MFKDIIMKLLDLANIIMGGYTVSYMFMPQFGDYAAYIFPVGVCIYLVAVVYAILIDDS